MKSARVIGRNEFGLTAQGLNQLLKAHGFLEGEPGAYRMTEKGMKYGEEIDHSRGTGGYAQFNRQWETRRWNSSLPAALRRDIRASRNVGMVNSAHTAHPDLNEDEPSFLRDPQQSNEDSELQGQVFAVAGVAAGILLAIAYGPMLWRKAKRRAIDVRTRHLKHRNQAR